MLELLDATADDRALLAKRMGPVLDPRTASWLATEVQNKNLSVTTIVRGGRKLGAVWWWYSKTNRSLVLNAGASFLPGENTTRDFMAAYEVLAHRLGAQSLELQTARAGIAKLYRQAGWVIEGVNMRKFLEL